MQPYREYLTMNPIFNLYFSQGHQEAWLQAWRSEQIAEFQLHEQKDLVQLWTIKYTARNFEKQTLQSWSVRDPRIKTMWKNHDTILLFTLNQAYEVFAAAL